MKRNARHPARSHRGSSAPSTHPLVSFSSILEKSQNKIWGCHLVIPKEVVHDLEGSGNRPNKSPRFVCILNGSLEFQCAMQRYGRGQRVITVNKGRQTSLKIDIGDDVHVRLKRDESMYGLPMPEEFSALLAQDKEGSKRFHALRPGIQRTLIYIVGNVKNPERRIQRAITVLRHLNTSTGKVDYRALYHDLMKGRAII